MTQTTLDTDTGRPAGRATRRPLMAVALTGPTLAFLLGLDSGDLFQILALEDLGLDARTIGIGLGFGVLSVPLQLWAARMPLSRARRNLQAWLVIAAGLCAVLLALAAWATPGSGVAASALAVAVVAETSLSVLYITAWQPLLSYALGPSDRQRLNAQGRAAGRGLLAVVLVLFGMAGHTSRLVFIGAMGALALGLAVLVRSIPTPTMARAAAPPAPTPAELQPPPTGRPHLHRPMPAEPEAPTGQDRLRLPAEAEAAARPAEAGARVRRRMPTEVRVLSATAGLATASAWPLFVTYLHDVMWPTVNLGLVATLQLGGAVAAGLLWRPTTERLVSRSRAAGLALVVAGGTLALVRPPVDGAVDAAVVTGAAVASSVATTTLFMALMELVHQSVDHDTSVRSLTIFDVVASTSMQLGMLAAGFLVSAAHDSGWALDPYRVYLVTMASVLAVTMLRPRWPHHR